MAGAVVVVEAGAPRAATRASASSAEPVVPAGKRTRASARWPFSTRVKRSRISGVGSPMATVRVTSVVPSRYWRAGIDQQQRAGAPVRLASRWVGPVVARWRRWRPRRRWCRTTGPSARRWPRGSPPAWRPPPARRAALSAPRWRPSAGTAPAPRRRGRGPGRAPSISTAFLQARGRAVGSAPRTTSAPAPLQRLEVPGRRLAPGRPARGWPARSPSAPAEPSGGSSVTPLPSQAGSSGVTLAGSRNRRAEPSAFRIAWASGSGERITSPPRMLNSQAMEAGAVISAASAPCSARLSPTRARLAAESSPANSQRMRDDRRLRLRRPRRAPGRVERIGLDRLQRRAGLGGRRRAAAPAPRGCAGVGS